MGADDPRGEAGAVIVVNPNSSWSVTEGMDRALDGLRRPGGPPIRCVTLEEGPPGIETDEHIRQVVAPLTRLIESLEGEAAAFVDACFSDPGLAELRAATAKPVLGIAESAYREAAAAGRFGVISILEASVPRHRAHIESLGLAAALAADRPIGLGVTALGTDPEATFARLLEVGGALRDADGGAALVLGCTGMAPFRARLEASLGIPVIDPVQAGVRAAIGALDGEMPIIDLGISSRAES